MEKNSDNQTKNTTPDQSNSKQDKMEQNIPKLGESHVYGPKKLLHIGIINYSTSLPKFDLFIDQEGYLVMIAQKRVKSWVNGKW